MDKKSTADALQPGDSFKLAGQRKYRVVSKVVELTGPGVPEVFQGHLLVLHDGCRQWRMEKAQEVLIQDDASC